MKLLKSCSDPGEESGKGQGEKSVSRIGWGGDSKEGYGGEWECYETTFWKK